MLSIFPPSDTQSFLLILDLYHHDCLIKSIFTPLQVLAHVIPQHNVSWGYRYKNKGKPLPLNSL